MRLRIYAERERDRQTMRRIEKERRESEGQEENKTVNLSVTDKKKLLWN